jgi:hypothetical protein
VSALFAVQKGRKKQPINVLLAGTPGIGKSTWAANAPEPLFIGAEETGELDVARLPQVTTYKDFTTQIDWLVAGKDVPKYQTIVIDTLDSVEKMLHEYILSTDPKGAKALMAAHGGYGKAYEMAEHELIALRSKLKGLRDDQGKNIVLLCHTKKTTATDTILGLQYDTYELNLHSRAQAVYVDWVSAVLFANYVVHAQSGTNTDRTFAMGEGERVMLTEKRPGHIGKNRFNLPYEMPLDFKAFESALEAFYDNGGPSVEHVLLTIEGLSENVPDELKPKIKREIEKAGQNVTKLKKIEQRVREVIQ